MRKYVIGAALLFLPFLYFLTPLPEASLTKDAGDFHAYAVNLVVGNGYSIDALTFSNIREPGYPVFLAFVYALFGIGNVTAVALLQALILGTAACVVWVTFVRCGEDWLGVCAGVLVALLPLYATYIPRVAPELLYVLLLTLTGCLVWRVYAHGEGSWRSTLLLGLLFGSLTLVRAQALFLPLFLIVMLGLFDRAYLLREWRRVGVTLVISLGMVFVWMGVAYAFSGHFTLTEVRPELSLHIRAARAAHTLSDNTQYGIDWLKRSISGGAETQLLSAMDYHSLTVDFVSRSQTPEARDALRTQNIELLLQHPFTYLYGCGIEVLKLLYVEHDYTGFLPRSVRAGTYVLLYLLTLVGVVGIALAPQSSLRTFGSVALLMIIYNTLIVIPFDALPRYNTPVLVFYCIVAVSGSALLMRTYALRQRVRTP